MGRIGNIVNRKNKQDSKKAGLFTKLGRYIMVAAKEGGGDPEYNSSLMSAIEKAKAANMPNDNIDRAIKKGLGELDGAQFSEVHYEGYGPGGVAVLVECLTDNVNRTAADIRSYFSKSGGNLGTHGCVSYLFDHAGVLVIDKEESIDEDELMMLALDAGADDFSAEEDHFEIYTSVEEFGAVRDALKEDGFSFSMAELRYLPQTSTSLSDETERKNMQRLMDSIEDNDDVQNVYSNWDMA
ncbi:MAG: YebC/PmpR family DNA-binding transcriptional regulator [Tissierellia bacterium]|nr:YebC/PmpR family DNA-binding transcriptional regulator [Tissierellia bacterium]